MGLFSDMMDEASEKDAEIARLRRIERASRQVLANWDEFGPEGGLDEYMDGLRKLLAVTDGQS